MLLAKAPPTMSDEEMKALARKIERACDADKYRIKEDAEEAGEKS